MARAGQHQNGPMIATTLLRREAKAQAVRGEAEGEGQGLPSRWDIID